MLVPWAYPGFLPVSSLPTSLCLRSRQSEYPVATSAQANACCGSGRWRALLLYAEPDGYIYHSFLGLNIPLGILAVQGWNRAQWRPSLGFALIAVATLVGLVPVVAAYRHTLQDARGELYLAPDEVRALDYLRTTPEPGGVLAPFGLGRTIPAYADRNTWIGHPALTPDFYRQRLPASDRFFAGLMTDADGTDFVRRSGAAFVLAGCSTGAEARQVLSELARSSRQFGCLVVYHL